MKIFITGATGFIGYHVVKQLRLQHPQAEITALKRERSEIKHLEPLNLKWVTGSVLDQKILQNHIPQDVDAIFHIAADTNMWSKNNDQQTATNVEGTKNMVRTAIEKNAKRFVYTSSVAAYGPQAGFLSEESPSLGEECFINYIKTKARAEQIVKQATKEGLHTVILNPTNVIGTHDLTNWGRMIWLVINKQLPFIPDGAGSFCDVTEVAKAHLAALTHGRPGENYILGGSEATYKIFIDMINHNLGRKTKIRVAPRWLLMTLAYIIGAVAAITKKAPDITPETVTLMTHPWLSTYQKAQRELGFKVVPLQEMVSCTVKWISENSTPPNHVATH